jgi:ATP-dependent RNA helicase RhlE
MPFSGFGLDPALLRAVRELGFIRPTPIQKDALPPALAGRDVLACAMTGSGKTAVFALAILQRHLAKRRGVTRALVLTPTRELAAQIDAHLGELATHTPLTGAAVFGGVGMGPQEHAFRSGTDVIVATPGRLLDHFRHPYARLDGLEILVIDEADRMLDMGFLPDIRRVLKHVPARRQTLFFSATMPPPIVGLAREMLHDPVTVNLERKAAPASGITQAMSRTRSCSRGRSTARTGSRSTSCGAASRASASTATARRRSARRRSRASSRGGSACSSRRTSRRAASTSRR